MLRDLRDVKAAQTSDQRQAHTAHERKGILGGSSDPDRRVRLLIGSGDHAEILHGEIFPGVREALLAPGFENDFEGFLEAFTTLVIGDAVARIGPGEAAAPNTEVETALANLIHG